MWSRIFYVHRGMADRNQSTCDFVVLYITRVNITRNGVSWDMFIYRTNSQVGHGM